MRAARTPRKQAIALLAATFFLLVAASFHSSDDNDIASLSSEGRPAAEVSRPPAADTCSACALDGIVLARLSLALPVTRPESIEPLTFSNLPAPFVSPRASVESRPPPPIA
jgi:hypothetical protein